MSVNLTIGINSIDELMDISSFNEIKEVYCGYSNNELSEKWPEAFGTFNRRGENSNFTGEEKFDNFALKAEKLSIFAYVTFNGLNTPEQYPFILKAIDFVSGYNAVKGIIVNDIGLLLRLKKLKYKKEILISTGGTTFNSSTVSFYKNLGASRIILDRQLKYNEILSILKNNPDMQFEIFLLLGNCLFIDGFCSFFHSLEESNKQEKFSLYKHNSGCGAFYGTCSAGKYTILSKDSKKNKLIGWDSEIKYMYAGCNLCLINKLREYNDRIVYKIVSRKNNMVNQFLLMRPFLKDMIKAEDNTDISELVNKVFGISCGDFCCYANERII